MSLRGRAGNIGIGEAPAERTHSYRTTVSLRPGVTKLATVAAQQSSIPCVLKIDHKAHNQSNCQSDDSRKDRVISPIRCPPLVYRVPVHPPPPKPIAMPIANPASTLPTALPTAKPTPTPRASPAPTCVLFFFLSSAIFPHPFVRVRRPHSSLPTNAVWIFIQVVRQNSQNPDERGRP